MLHCTFTRTTTPSWYPLGLAWWSASNGCVLIYVLSTSQPINTPGSECIYFCTNFANPKQIWEKFLEADHSSVLFQILHQEISRSQYEHLNICNRFQTTRMMGQTWWPNFQIAQLLTFCIPWNSTLRWNKKVENFQEKKNWRWRASSGKYLSC